MFKNAALGIAAAGLVAASALVASAPQAQAGKKFYFSIQTPSAVDGKAGTAGQASSCRHWKRKWRRTGRQRFLLQYRNCLLHDS